VAEVPTYRLPTAGTSSGTRRNCYIEFEGFGDESTRLEKALTEGAECSDGHIRFHVINPDHHRLSGRAKAAQELMDVIKIYMK
jgi:hypothetical protein